MTVRLNVVKELKSTLSGREFQRLITRSRKKFARILALKKLKCMYADTSLTAVTPVCRRTATRVIVVVSVWHTRTTVLTRTTAARPVYNVTHTHTDRKKKKFISSRQIQYRHTKCIQTPNIYNCLPEAARELL